MIANQLYEAAAQLREIQQNILDKQRFRGYSGWARAVSGTLALMAATVMAMPQFPNQPKAHLFAWGSVFVMGFVMNYGALVHWFLFDSAARRELRRLKPALDTLPPLIVGGILTLTMIQNQQYDFLFGIWMCLFGLACMVSRPILPRWNWHLGLLYIIAGIFFLLSPNKTFVNPWPMGIVFFFGEWAGGLIFHFDNRKKNSDFESVLSATQTSKEG